MPFRYIWGQKVANLGKNLLFESLESRLAMVAEGGEIFIDTTLDTSGVVGSISAHANWGDGTVTPLNVANSPNKGPIAVRFDYSYDTTGFFNAPERRQILQAAADIVFSKFSDQLAAITPSGTNTWSISFPNPTSGALVSVPGGNLGANELVIYPGARDLPGNQVAEGGPGNSAWRGNSAWGQAVVGRGQPNATGNSQSDFATWGGIITVDPNVSWHFGSTTDGLDASKYDFLTAVSHEFFHILGFGVAPSWSRLVSGGSFLGVAATAANGGVNVPLSGEQSHWREGMLSVGQESLMDPSINGQGIRKLPTPLDLAGLSDIGWNIINQSVRVSGSHVYGDDLNAPIEVTVIGSQAGARAFNVQTANVTNVAPTLNSIPDQTARVNVPLVMTDLGVFQDQGFGPSETFRFEIDWGDGTPVELGTAMIDRNGSPGSVTLGSFDGTHTYLQAGTFQVRSRVIDDNAGSDEKSFRVQVAGAPKISLSGDRTAFVENAGANAAVITVSIENFDNRSDLTIQLTNNDPSEASIPASVVLGAGQTQVTFSVTAVDDARLDGTQFVQFAASLNGINSLPLELQVLDHESVSIALNISSIREDAGPGAAVLRVTRSDVDEPTPLTIQLASSNPSAATIPATVDIPAGVSFIDVSVTAVDDSIVDGAQNTQLSANATNYPSNSVPLTVQDYEPLQWAPKAVEIIESSETVSRSVQLSLPAPAGPSGVVVTLTASIESQVSLPALVNFAPGQQVLNVALSAINDTFAESTKALDLIASAPGYVSSTIRVTLQDTDTSPWTNSKNNFDVDGSGTVEPIDVLVVINFLQRTGSIALPTDPDPAGQSFVDVDGDGILTPIDVLQVINQLRRQST
jgi:Dockerin type I domain